MADARKRRPRFCRPAYLESSFSTARAEKLPTPPLHVIGCHLDSKSGELGKVWCLPRVLFILGCGRFHIFFEGEGQIVLVLVQPYGEMGRTVLLSLSCWYRNFVNKNIALGFLGCAAQAGWLSRPLSPEVQQAGGGQQEVIFWDFSRFEENSAL